MESELSCSQRWCTASSVVKSGRVIQALPIKLFLEGSPLKAVVLARPQTLEFAIIEGIALCESFEVPVFAKVLACSVIPTQYDRSDLLCVLTGNLEYFVVRVTARRTLEVLESKKLERLAVASNEQFFMEADFISNVRDTEAHLFIQGGATVTMVSLVEKRDGLSVTSSATARLELPEVLYAGAIRQSHSKYKSPTWGLICVVDGVTCFRMASGSPLRLLDSPNICKHNLLHFYSGKHLVLLTGRELFMYGYQSTKPVMTHRLPLLECANRILFLEEVYCVVGESLLLFSQEGVRDYGALEA